MTELRNLPQPPPRWPGRLAIGPRLANGDFKGGRHLKAGRVAEQAPFKRAIKAQKVANRKLAGGLRAERRAANAFAKEQNKARKAHAKRALAQAKANRRALRGLMAQKRMQAKAAARAARVRVKRPKPPKSARKKAQRAKQKNHALKNRPRRARTGRSGSGRLARAGRIVSGSFGAWLLRQFAKHARKMLKQKRTVAVRNHGFNKSGKGGKTGRAGFHKRR